MALVNDTQLEALATDIIDNVGYAMTTQARTQSIVKMQAYLKKVMTYVAGDPVQTDPDKKKGYLEIGTGVVSGAIKCEEAYVSGSGSNHVPPNPADMTAPPYPVTGSVVAVQTNGGRGLVK